MSRNALSRAEYKALCYAVHERDNWRCRVPYCKYRNNLHAHHLLFRSSGGLDTMENIITICDNCHDAVHKTRTLVILGTDANYLLSFIKKGIIHDFTWSG